MDKKQLDAKKEMLDNLLNRSYDISFDRYTELNKIINDYETEDCLKWDEEKIHNTYLKIEKELIMYVSSEL